MSLTTNIGSDQYLKTASILTKEDVIISRDPEYEATYSSVYQGSYRGNEVSIKVLRVIHNEDEETMRRRLRREARIWPNLDHPSVACFYGYIEAGGMFGSFGSLITPNGDAASFLKEGGHGHSMDFEERLRLWRDTAAGVSYLHNHDPVIIHGDLRSVNIFIDDERNPKICDFGLAQIYFEESYSGLTSVTTHTGTIRYIAPELLIENPRPTKASDMWALGCIGLEFLYQKPPYLDFTENQFLQISNAIQDGRLPASRPDRTSGPGVKTWDILEKCWRKDSLERIKGPLLVVSLDSLLLKLRFDEMQNALAAKEVMIDEMQNILATKEVVIREIKNALAAKEVMIDEMRSTLATKEVVIREINNTLAAKKLVIRRYKRQEGEGKGHLRAHLRLMEDQNRILQDTINNNVEKAKQQKIKDVFGSKSPPSTQST